MNEIFTHTNTAIRGIVDPRVGFCNWILRDPLALRVLLVCAFRTWLHKEPEKRFGLEYGEFSISKTETDLFGLKRTQQGKLDRSIKKMTHLGYISKTGKRIDNNRTTIYRYESNRIIFPLMKNRQQNDQQINSRQTLTTETTETIKDFFQKPVTMPPTTEGKTFEQVAWAAAVEASNRGRQR